MRAGARANGAMAGCAAASALVACLLGAPPELRRSAAADARATASALCLAAIYSGDQARMDADFGFYSDGFMLLQRDLVRDAPLLFAQGPLTERCALRIAFTLLTRCLRSSQLRADLALWRAWPHRQRAARDRIGEDIRALFPFFIVLTNTWPLTKPVLAPVLERGWVPRRWLLPSSFDDVRLGAVARARRVGAAAAAAAPPPPPPPPQ
jgi:hypothetical protein